MPATVEGNVLRWDKATILAEWTLTNINSDRHAEGFCINDKDAGVGDLESPWITTDGIEHWRLATVLGTRVAGSAIGLFFQFADDGSGSNASGWQGPYDTWDDALGELKANLTMIAAREGLDDTKPYAKFRIRIYPA